MVLLFPPPSFQLGFREDLQEEKRGTRVLIPRPCRKKIVLSCSDTNRSVRSDPTRPPTRSDFLCPDIVYTIYKQTRGGRARACPNVVRASDPRSKKTNIFRILRGGSVVTIRKSNTFMTTSIRFKSRSNIYRLVLIITINRYWKVDESEMRFHDT